MADCSFPKKLRLLNAAEYKAVFSGAHYKVSCKYFLILALRSCNSFPRLGLVVAKKNVNLAVDRNRIKRLAREFFRTRAGALGGLDMIILTRNKAGNLDNSELTGKLQQLGDDLVSKFAAHKPEMTQND